MALSKLRKSNTKFTVILPSCSESGDLPSTGLNLKSNSLWNAFLQALFLAVAVVPGKERERERERDRTERKRGDGAADALSTLLKSLNPPACLTGGFGVEAASLAAVVSACLEARKRFRT